METDASQSIRERLSSEDVEFLMTSELLRATPDQSKRRLLLSMEKTHIPAGERFIAQGEAGDRFYLIQSGSCIVTLEKGGEIHRLARLKPGEVVGEMGVLTGENRSANVVAEADLTLWAVGIRAFEELCHVCPELREFLTEIATERLCNQKITAERTIGRYKISEIVGEGGWSLVYKGQHSFLNLPVAIKMLKHNMALDSDFFEKFQNEARIIAGLTHENIVRVYDIEHVHKTVFIIMEYLDGITVRQVLRRIPGLPLNRIVHVLKQVCDALKYAHHQGIVHQDVKPGNIFLQKQDQVKIVDFGLASPIGGCADDMPGTPFYMAPEQIEGDPVDPRTDIYSLGITAYEMAVGQRPFPDDVCEVLKAHITQETPDPRALNPELPTSFSAFIQRATRKEPGRRYQNTDEVLEAISPLGDATFPEPETTSPRKRRMVGLFMFCSDDHRVELNKELEEFSERIKKFGAELRVADFDDI